MMMTQQKEMQGEIIRLDLEIILPEDIGRLMTLMTQPSLIERIKEVQKEDPKLQKIREEVKAGLRQDVVIHADGLLQFGSRLYVPSGEVQKELLFEAYNSLYSVHPGVLKCTETSSNTFGVTDEEKHSSIRSPFSCIPISQGGTPEDGRAATTTPYS